MSTSAPKPAYLRSAVILAGVVLLSWFVGNRVPQLHGQIGTLSALGYFLLAGSLVGRLLEPLGLPHLSGYLLTGIVGGPYVLSIVDAHTVEALAPVNTLTLCLIALAGGTEMRWPVLKASARLLVWSTFIQAGVVFLCSAGAFLLLRRYLPEFATLSPTLGIAVAALWGVIAVSRSPSVVLGVLSERPSQGPLTNFSVAFVMTSDVVVVVMLSTTLWVTSALVAGTPFSEALSEVNTLGRDLISSVSVGTTLGLIVAGYLRLFGSHVVLLLLLLAYGVTAFLHYVYVDPLLAFLVAGFVVRNVTRQGDKLAHAVQQTSSVVFVAFFATAGAGLNLPILRGLWPIALALCGVRALATLGAHFLSCAATRTGGSTRSWGWSPLISQAGLTLGLSVVIQQTLPDIGRALHALVIACVAIHELTGPVLFKLGLDKSGEVAA